MPRCFVRFPFAYQFARFRLLCHHLLSYPGPSVWYRPRRQGEHGSGRTAVVEVDCDEVLGGGWDSMHSSAADLLEAVQSVLMERDVWTEN